MLYSGRSTTSSTATSAMKSLIMSLSPRGLSFHNDFHNIVTQVLLFAVAVYRSIFTAWLGGACRFQPTCSDYAAQALKMHSLPVALRLILTRLSQCHPWGKFGFDPVPSSHNCGCDSHSTVRHTIHSGDHV